MSNDNVSVGRSALLAAAVFGLTVATMLPHYVTADASLLTISEIVAAAPDWSLSVREAELRLAEAQGDLAVRPGLDSTDLSLSSSYLGTEQSRTTLGASIGVAPVPQVRLGADVTSTIYGESDAGVARDDSVERSLSATFSPFAAPRTTWQQERSVTIAILQLDRARTEAQQTAEAQSLAILTQQNRITIAEAERALRNAEYDLILRRREIGDASFNDVQEAQSRMIGAQRAVFQAQQQLLRYEADLARALPLRDGAVGANGDNQSNGDVATAGSEVRRTALVAPLPLEELRAMVDQRERVVERQRSRQFVPDTCALSLAEIELRALEAQRRTVLHWRPDLSITGGVTFSSETNDPTPAAGVQLRLSPSQLAEREQRELDQQIALRLLEIASERAIAKLELELAIAAAELDREALRVSEAQLDRDRTAIEEGQLLVGRGAITPLELQQLEINVTTSQLSVFEAYADLYVSLGELLSLVEP